MKNEEVHITFKTDKETAHLLTQIAHLYGKTQSELINELCKDHIEDIKAFIKSQDATAGNI